ncbi:hypothetical protein NESM_000568000 [Novymonas esmeraldas]|uniref:Uncharacterized protein n=1 Tax=Novymonas esmeraldas TaxID=1808958 RepID=A0AAW0ETM8_9TRYP
MASARVTALAAVAVLLLIATGAAAQASQTCSDTSNPLVNIDYTNAGVSACVTQRCTATLGVAPTTTTNGDCNGVATAESAVACYTLQTAYNAYYACLVRALQGTATPGLTAFGADATKFMSTPGFPYRLSLLGCYACNHYRTTVFPASGSSCTNWTCAAISSQSPTATASGRPDKGYNYRLCSTGCIAAIMMIPFVVVSCAMFLACGCCWPSPSLKTTYEAAMREEEEDKHRKRSDDEDEDDPREPADRDLNIAHEPAPANDRMNHPELDTEHSSRN